ncbi:unnamed protein product [Pichia kudriavzevii]
MSLNLKKVSGTLSGISPLIVGGAVFNTQYNDNPTALPIYRLLEKAFSLGINAIDTSPYYGPSEELLGNTLRQMAEDGKVERNNYYICTKVGRLHLDDFDYTPSWVEKSVTRSLQRFHTSYLDVVFLHDIEFKTADDIIGALQMLMALKKRGLIRYVGISGYPVHFLYQIAKLSKETPDIGPLDLVMSYSNMCLQNTTLQLYYDKFLSDTGVKLVNNASILSMSLLRNQETKSFHPASSELKKRCHELGSILQNKYNVDLADLATRFAIREWKDKHGKTVLGVSTVEELEIAWKQYQLVLDGSLDDKDRELIDISREFLGEQLNETWESGIKH